MKLRLLLLSFLFSALSWGQATIAIQDFETTPATPTWGYSNTNGGVSTTNSGTPNNQRIRSGVRSFQTIKEASTLTFNDINVSGYNSVSVIVRVSSISVTTGNGADAADYIRAFVKLDAGSFLTNTQANANISVNGNSNARWGYNATGTSTNVGTNVVVAGTSGTNAGTVYSTLIINIPDGTSTVGLRLNALNDDNNEIWCVDDVEIVGIPALPNPPVITSLLTASANTGAAFSYDITATNAPTSYNATGLPAGLSINTATGQITGSVLVAGTYNVTISATNAYGTDSETLVITITSGPCYSANAPTFSTSGYTTSGDVDAGGTPTNTIRLASGGTAGSISTTASGVAAGPVTLRFRAKGYAPSENSVTVTLDGQTQTVTTLPTANFDWVELTFASVSANPTLTFSTTSGNRVHIGNVEIYCGPITLADIVLSSNNPAVAASTITQAENNHVIYAFDLAVTAANATLNNVVFNTTGGYAASNITNFKLWYSTDATFDSATDTFLDNETTGLGAGSHTFTGFTRTINNGTTGYFFITTDIPCAATVANDIIVSAITTADLTFVSGNKSGTAFASGTHTIVGATPNNVTGLTTSTCENGSATVSWNTPTGCYDNVLVFVSETPFTTAVPTGNGAAYSASTNFTSGTPFDGGYTAYKGTGTSVTITGLTNGTTYYYKVFTRNGLLWSNGVVVSCTPTMAYCALTATDTGFEYISNVTVGTDINNNSSSSGYANYTSQVANATIGVGLPISVTISDSYTSDNVYVYIDWNQDGDWSDADEAIAMNYTAASGNFTATGTITAPASALLGNTRMRVVVVEGTVLNACNGGSSFTYGEVEDYTIEVINACTPTTSVSSIFPTSGPVGTVVTVNGSGFTTASSVSFGSVVASFNIISNTVIEVEVPSGATTSNIVIQDGGGCNLSYSSFTVITSDNASCEGNVSTTDLIIYELHDEYSGDGGFITLYNGTAATVNLADYRIYRAGDYGAAMSNYATLTGTIAPGALGVVTVDAASCGTATNGDLTAGFNENDQIQLRNAAGTIVIDDVHAYIPGPGYYMVRNAGALSARTTFVAADWSTTPLVAGQCIPSAGLVPPSGTGDSPAVTLNPLDVNASCSSSTATLTVAGTEGVAGGVGLAYQWYVNVPGTAGWTAVANGGVYSGATSAALNISSTSGLNNYQYYCQIRENDATCYTATEAAIIKDGATVWNGTTWSNGVPDLTMLAVIDGNYDTALHGDFSCCSLIVNATYRLDVRANNYIEIQNDLTVNGIFKVWDDGSLVQIDDTGVNTGNISYQRIASVKLQDYVYWSSPVSGFDVNSISPATPAYYHWEWNPTIVNPNGGEGNWVNASTTMLGGKGYIVRAPNGFSNTANQNWTATFNNGVANNGVYSPSIARGNDLNAGTPGPNGVMRTITDDNWNLLGNPYPSAISINSFLLANPDLDGFVRLWTHGNLPTYTVDPFYNNFVYNYTASDYITINGAGATSGPGTLSVIGGGQGFFVLMNDGVATTSTATFNNAMRNTGYSNSQFYRNANVTNAGVGGDIERHRIWLDLISPTNETTRTLVAYVDGATPGKDRMFDALTDYKSAQNFYSLIGDQVMTIQGKGLPFVQEDTVPLGVKLPSNGIYKIAIGAIDGLFSTNNQNIYVEDKLLGVIHDLRQSPYSFSVNSGILNDRFVLRYTNETLGNEDFETNSNVLIFSSDVISVNAVSRTIQNVKIYNVLGQLLLDAEAVNSNTFETSKLQKNNTTLLVQVTLENGIKVTKKIVF